MADPNVVKGAAVLLFDRLVDFDPASTVEAKVYRHLSEGELLASIMREIERIVGTKRPVALSASFTMAELTVLDYGVPDHAGLSPHDLAGCRLYALALENAIKAFEPRLLNPSVRVAAAPDMPTSVQIDVSGAIRPGDYVQDVWFPIHITPRAVGASVAGTPAS